MELFGVHLIGANAATGHKLPLMPGLRFWSRQGPVPARGRAADRADFVPVRQPRPSERCIPAGDGRVIYALRFLSSDRRTRGIKDAIRPTNLRTQGASNG
jgi:hypothetical protein